MPLGNNADSPATAIHNSPGWNIDIQLHAAVLTSQWWGNITNQHSTIERERERITEQHDTFLVLLSLPSPTLCARLYDKEFQRKITVTSKISSLIYS